MNERQSHCKTHNTHKLAETESPLGGNKFAEGAKRKATATVGDDVCQLRFWPSTAVEEGRQREVVLLFVRRPLKSSPENHNTVFQ